MRITPITTMVLALTLGAAAVHADDATAYFKQHLTDIVQVKPQAIDSPAIGKTMVGDVYQLTISTEADQIQVLVDRTSSGLVTITKPTTTAAMPPFVTLIKPDFSIKSDEDAHVFEDTLDVLYPLDSDDADSARAKTIRHDGNTWTFVRGTFFDHLKGFIVTTDSNGKITKIEYSLDIKK